jgi:hypothetical protein
VALLDAVGVVSGAFDCSWAAAVAAFGQGFTGDLGQDAGQDLSPGVRGESPPSR